VLVLKDGDPVLMPWVDKFPAILEAWNPGQEDGNVVARLLFGVVNPSGKLPMTYSKLAGDIPTATVERYPGVTVNGIPTAYYSEGLKMGYRWYDAQNIAPLFPFGHGLSYTTFAYSNLQVSPAQSDGTTPFTVSFTVRNTGNKAGADVPQIYAGFASSYGEPPKRLVGFQKVLLNPGEQRQVSVTIDPRANAHPLSYWDTDNQLWSTMNGGITFYLARSARNIDSKIGATLVFPNSGKANDVNGDMQVNCLDLTSARLAIGTRTGQVGYLPTADIDHNGVIDVRDISAIARTLPAGTVCK
jgi:beta-glucosidase